MLSWLWLVNFIFGVDSTVGNIVLDSFFLIFLVPVLSEEKSWFLVFHFFVRFVTEV